MGYKEKLQDFYRQFCEDTGRKGAVDPDEVAQWAYRKKLWIPQTRDVVSRLAKDLADAWREEYRTDRRGLRYRAMHAVRGFGPQQRTLWADMDTASREHMERAFAQRRRQIVGDCVQLKTDVDVFNDKRPSDEPINLVLDFTYDVEELQQKPDSEAA
jgi:hypothetical protein